MPLLTFISAMVNQSQGRHASAMLSLYDSTSPDPKTGRILPQNVAAAISGNRITTDQALALLGDKSTGDPQTYMARGGTTPDLLRIATMLNTLRFFQASGDVQRSAELGYQAALQELPMPDRLDMAEAKRSRIAPLVDMLTRSENTQHWQTNAKLFADELTKPTSALGDMSVMAQARGAAKTKLLLDFSAQNRTVPVAVAALQDKTKGQVARDNYEMVVNSIASGNYTALAKELREAADELDKAAKDNSVTAHVSMAKLRATINSQGNPFGLNDVERNERLRQQGQLVISDVNQHKSQMVQTAKWMRGVATSLEWAESRSLPIVPPAGAAPQDQVDPATLPPDDQRQIDYPDQSDVLRQFYREHHAHQLWEQLGTAQKNAIANLAAIRGGRKDSEMESLRQKFQDTIDYTEAALSQMREIDMVNRARIADAMQQHRDSVKLIPPLAKRTKDGWAGEDKIRFGEYRPTKPGQVQEQPPPEEDQSQRPAPRPGYRWVETDHGFVEAFGDDNQIDYEKLRLTPQSLVDTAKGNAPASTLDDLLATLDYKRPGMVGFSSALNNAARLTDPLLQNTPDTWSEVSMYLTDMTAAYKKLHGGNDAPEMLRDQQDCILKSLGFTPEMLAMPPGSSLGDFSLYTFNALPVSGSKSKPGRLQYLAGIPSGRDIAIGLHKLLNSYDPAIMMFGTDCKASPQSIEHVVNQIVNARTGGLLTESQKAKDAGVKPVVAPATQPITAPSLPPSLVPPLMRQPTSNPNVIDAIPLSTQATNQLDDQASEFIRRNAGKLIKAHVVLDKNSKPFIDGDSGVIALCGKDENGQEYCVQVHTRLVGVNSVEITEKNYKKATAKTAELLLGATNISFRPHPTSPIQPGRGYQRWLGSVYAKYPDGSIKELNAVLSAPDLVNDPQSGFNTKYSGMSQRPPDPPRSDIEDSLTGGSNDDPLTHERVIHDNLKTHVVPGP